VHSFLWFDLFTHSYTTNNGIALREYPNGTPYMEQENLLVVVFDTIANELKEMQKENANG